MIDQKTLRAKSDMNITSWSFDLCNSRKMKQMCQITAKRMFTFLHRAWAASVDLDIWAMREAYTTRLTGRRFPLFLYLNQKIVKL